MSSKGWCVVIVRVEYPSITLLCGFPRAGAPPGERAHRLLQSAQAVLERPQGQAPFRVLTNKWGCAFEHTPMFAELRDLAPSARCRRDPGGREEISLSESDLRRIGAGTHADQRNPGTRPGL